MSSSARSVPNIAFIKYWGNRDESLRLPAADSLSMTLNGPTVDITVDHAETLTLHSINADGSERILNEKDIERYAKHLKLTRAYLESLGARDAIAESASITIHSHIPSSIGLASSAAVFSALAKAYAGLIRPVIDLDLAQTSVVARLGSGSASRSIYGGYVAMREGKGNEIGSSVAEQIADEHHWHLHDIVVIPSHKEKAVGSTEGHALAGTSPYFLERLEAVRTRRQHECEEAIRTKDFERLQAIAEEDAMNMHHVMETSTPPLRYLSDVTHRIRTDIETLRKAHHIPVFYTMDAGPTVHLICTDEGKDAVLSFAREQQDCTIVEASVGPGAIDLPS